MKKKELKEELQNYLDSKSHAGGLYGLTIQSEGFVEGLIKIFNKFKIIPKVQSETKKHLTLAEVHDLIIKGMENAG
jgi:hypothetical protein